MIGLRTSLVVGCLLLGSLALAHKPYAKKEIVLLMPVRVDAKVSDTMAEQLPLFVRAASYKGFQERNFASISPVQLKVSEDELNTKLSDDVNWNPGMFDKLGERWKARYIATIAIVSIESGQGAVEGTAGGPPPPGGQLNTTIKMVGSLYDHKTKKFVFEKREISVSRKVGMPGPDAKQPQAEMISAVMDGTNDLFRSFWIKYRKVERGLYDRGGG